jgi:hypothetical protein
MKNENKSNLLTPRELLSNAEAMYITGNPIMYRAAILEAITALEAFVEDTVFGMLESMLDPLLLKWMRAKSKMDFDSRLTVFTPIATGLEIDKGNSLWKDYKESKGIRNTITHTGSIASKEQAAFVLKTVNSWLTYLGSTVGIKRSLLDFKDYIEKNAPSITSQEQCVDELVRYFSDSSAVVGGYNIAYETDSPFYGMDKLIEPDLILHFDSSYTIIEIKGQYWQPLSEIKDSIEYDQLHHREFDVKQNAIRQALHQKYMLIDHLKKVQSSKAHVNAFVILLISGETPDGIRASITESDEGVKILNIYRRPENLLN